MSRLGGIGHRLYTGDISYDFIGKRRRFYLFSAVLMLVSVVALAVNHLTLGIEFRGGADFQVTSTVTSQSTDQMRAAVDATGLPDLDDTEITTIGGDRIQVQTRTLSTEEVATVRAAIAKQAGVSGDDVAYSLIGASWGQQITQKALIALIVFLVLVGLVIWAYFRNGKMSIAALVALLHDLVLTVGIYALVGFTVTPATLIGVLTILGYSLYDTVVVFDKVRENVRDLRSSTRQTYSEAANLAVNQVLVRSINTTVIGVLPVAALLFAGAAILGTGPLKDLALALFVGMVSGAYSSIFIATPLLAQLKEREPDMIKLAARVKARRNREAGRDGSELGSSERRRRRSRATDPDESDGFDDTGDVEVDESTEEPSDAELAATASSTRSPNVTVRVAGQPVSGRTATGESSSSGSNGRAQPQRRPRSQRKK